jgi:release factor glutamine methyltransferase
MVVEPDDIGLAVLVRTLRAAGCVFAEEEAALLCAEAADVGALAELTRRRVAGEPLELVLGWAEFCGLRIVVEPGVFVPRRRTEFLARSAAALLGPGEIAVDLCCGAGAVGAALLVLVGRSGESPGTSIAESPGASTGVSPGTSTGAVELHAADIDPVAVRCARRNLDAAIRRGTAFVYEGDLDVPLPARLAGRVSVLTANVPYVPSAEVPLLPAEAREHEPLTTLDGGADGLDVLRRVVAAAAHWLRPGGSVLIEISERQSDAAAAAFLAAGLQPTELSSDDYATNVMVGRKA